MISNGNKGNSTLTGADFENKTSFLKRINMLSKVDSKTYELFIKDEFNFMYINTNIFYVPKNDMYSYLYHRHGINYRKIIHKKILPDEVIINENTKQVFIFEKKFQMVGGSVDEKLQTCHFKKHHLSKLFKKINYTVHYTYILNDWFKRVEYKDVLEYIHDMECDYFFNKLSKEQIKKMFEI